MGALRNYFLKHSEQLFALAILLSVPIITYLIPYKLVFLNFFFIVILVGVYYLEAHKALMGGCTHYLARCHLRLLFPQLLYASFYRG